jgi:putative DNA primase/helicase
MDVRKAFEGGFGKRNVIEHNGTGGEDAGQLGRLVSAKSVRSRRVDWLWPGFIAFGGLAFLTGDAGVGKGLFEADLIARLSRARKFPDGCRAPRIATLVYSKEENLETTQVPRLKAARADLERVSFARPGGARNGAKPAPLVPLPDGIEHVRRFAVQSRARLIVFDPIFQFLPSRADTNSETAVFEALEPLIELSQELNLAVLCLRHPNKKTELTGIYRMMGSGAFGQIPRTIIAVKLMPGDEHGRMLVCEKNNLMDKPAALPFRIVDGAGKIARVEWGNPLTRAEEEAAAEAAAATPSKIERACELVSAMLADGDADATAVKRTAEAMGISAASLHRAYQRLKVESWPLQDDRTGLMKGMVLALPGHHGERAPRRRRSSRQAGLGFTGEQTAQPPRGDDHPVG